MVHVQQEFVSVGVNRVVGALAWGTHGGVAYGGHNLVVLYDVNVSCYADNNPLITRMQASNEAMLPVPHLYRPPLLPTNHWGPL